MLMTHRPTELEMLCQACTVLQPDKHLACFGGFCLQSVLTQLMHMLSWTLATKPPWLCSVVCFHPAAWSRFSWGFYSIRCESGHLLRALSSQTFFYCTNLKSIYMYCRELLQNICENKLCKAFSGSRESCTKSPQVKGEKVRSLDLCSQLPTQLPGKNVGLLHL